MKQSKLLIKLYFYIIILSFTSLLIGFYIYDPLQLFHKPWGRDITFNKNMRQQAAGIINNYEFNSIIIGSSILENTSSKEASKKLGGDFINLSLSGSSYYERHIVLKHLFTKHSIKKVIYSLDAGSYIHQQKEYPSYPLSLFEYLYDDSSLNDMKAYFNYDYLKCLIKYSRDQECIGENSSLDRPNTWFHEEGNKIRFGGLDKWFEAQNSRKIKDVFKDIVSQTNAIAQGKFINDVNINSKIVKAEQYVKDYLLDLAQKNPNIDFILIFPPYSRLQYALWAQYNTSYFKLHKAVLEYLVIESEKITNIKVFAYGNQDFLDDISNYKDLSHYHESIDSYMLSSIKNDDGRLTKENISNYLNDITKKAKKYDIISIGKKINQYLEQSQKNKR